MTFNIQKLKGQLHSDFGMFCRNLFFFSFFMAIIQEQTVTSDCSDLLCCRVEHVFKALMFQNLLLLCSNIKTQVLGFWWYWVSADCSYIMPFIRLCIQPTYCMNLDRHRWKLHPHRRYLKTAILVLVPSVDDGETAHFWSPTCWCSSSDFHVLMWIHDAKSWCFSMQLSSAMMSIRNERKKMKLSEWVIWRKFTWEIRPWEGINMYKLQFWRLNLLSSYNNP